VSDASEPPRAGGAAPAARLRPALLAEAAFAFAFSALLCWNAWPWLVQLDPDPATQRASGALTAVLVYGLAWPAIAAAIAGAQRHYCARLAERTRLALGSALFLATLLLLAGKAL
jgi:hypothetical protein